jgi:2-methylcitrate dehydratase
MQFHTVHTDHADSLPPQSKQLAWSLATVAAEYAAPIEPLAIEVIVSQLIDSMGCALTTLEHPIVANARSQAVAHIAALHPRSHGARIIGLSSTKRYDVQWAAYANAIAIAASELSQSQESMKPCRSVKLGEIVSALLAVAQQCGRSGKDLLRGIKTAGEIQTFLTNYINPNDFGIDCTSYLAAALIGGISACLALDVGTTFHAIKQALHADISSRFSRFHDEMALDIYSAAHIRKIAIEVVDLTMRGKFMINRMNVGSEDSPLNLLSSENDDYRGDFSKIKEIRRAFTTNQRVRSGVDNLDRFHELTKEVVSEEERLRFLQIVKRLPQLASGELRELHIAADLLTLIYTEPDGRGIF